MTLREKTNQKYKNFFKNVAVKHKAVEFEIASSEIQRGTGTTGDTMKRALEALEAEGYLEIKPGKNSRYRKLKLNIPISEIKTESESESEAKTESDQTQSTVEIKVEPLNILSKEGSTPVPPSDSRTPSDNKTGLEELEEQIDLFRKRCRTQEMTIALLQDRVAEIEDRLFKK